VRQRWGRREHISFCLGGILVDITSATLHERPRCRLQAEPLDTHAYYVFWLCIPGVLLAGTDAANSAPSFDFRQAEHFS